MIREITLGDVDRLLEIHHDNDLPEECFPNLSDPLCLVKLCVEKDEKPVMASALLGTAELYLLVDHSYGTPAERWEILQELCAKMKAEAWAKGLSQMTCWVPPEIEKTFKDRLEELGFVRSPWSSYTMPLV